jgi:predicted acetyltransferase
MKFVHLQTHHASALQRFLLDFEDQGESNIPAYFAKRDWRHQRIVDTLMAWSKGEILPENWTPCFTFFAEEEGELCGVYNIRNLGLEDLERWNSHVGYSVRPSYRGRGLGTAMLTDACGFARSFGMTCLELTCDTKNPSSRRVIEKNGGELVETYLEEGRLTQRFSLAV